MAEPSPCQICGREIYFEGVCYACRQRMQSEKYQALPPEEVAVMEREVCSGIETIGAWEKVDEDFWGLLAYHGISTRNIAAAALAKDIFYPWSIYRDASPEVRDHLIELLMQPACPNANDLLQALAMQGDEGVLEAFCKLEANPLPWRESLYVDPSVYAESGGWTFDAQGSRQDLVHHDCYIMLPGQPDGAAKVGVPRGEHCPVCGCQLVDILTLDGNEPRLTFLGLGGVVRIPACPNCASMCERTLVRYTPGGESSMELVEPFEEENNVDETALKELTGNSLTLGKQAVAPFYASGCDDVVSIGGMPDWVQDAQYETCPDCGKKMRYIAGLPWDVLMAGMEGTLFVEICTDCRVIAMIHQQT